MSLNPTHATGLNHCQADSLHESSASAVAECLVDLSAFVYKGYCTGIIMLDLPIFATAKNLSNRLYGYAFSLVIERSPGFLTRPGQNTSLNTSRAVDSMSQLAAFLENKAHDLEVCGFANGHEVALAEDLRFFEQYTRMLLQTAPSRLKAVDSSAPPINASIKVPEGRALSEKSRGKAAEAQPTGSDEPGRDAQDNSGVEHVAFEYNVTQAIEAPLPSPGTVMGQSLKHKNHPTDVSSDIRRPTHLDIPPLESGATTPAGATTPHDLRPTPFNVEHAPHPLQGSRLWSPSCIADNEAFSRLHSGSDKTLRQTPNSCTTLQIGHSTEDPFQSRQYVDASTLGYTGIKALRLVHPFCAREIHELNFDVLRFLNVVLGERVVARAVEMEHVSAKRERAANRALRKSREIVEREIGIRNWEINRAPPQPHSTASDDRAEALHSQPTSAVHECHASESVAEGLEAATPPPSHISWPGISLDPDDSASQHELLPLPVRKRLDTYSIHVEVPRGLQGPKDIHVRFADEAPADRFAGSASPARTSSSVPTELLRAPGGTGFGANRVDEVGSAAEVPVVETAQGPTKSSQIASNDRGPSVEQLQAQLTALQLQLANARPRDRPRPEVSVYVRPNMPESPLQGSPSSIQGFHGDCECAFQPDGEHSSPLEETHCAVTVPTPDDSTVIHTIPKPVSTVVAAAAAAQPSTLPTSLQAEATQWKENTHTFNGRSSPPYVAYTKCEDEDGKMYILDTPDGKPICLETATAAAATTTSTCQQQQQQKHLTSNNSNSKKSSSSNILSNNSNDKPDISEIQHQMIKSPDEQEQQHQSSKQTSNSPPLLLFFSPVLDFNSPDELSSAPVPDLALLALEAQIPRSDTAATQSLAAGLKSSRGRGRVERGGFATVGEDSGDDDDGEYSGDDYDDDGGGGGDEEWRRLGFVEAGCSSRGRLSFLG